MEVKLLDIGEQQV